MMIQKTKIQLLPIEMELVSSTDFILTKNAVLQKIKLFLEELQAKQKTILEKKIKQLPKEILKISPKISKGENYRGLPWLVLDNPRCFEKENVFAIRTMFWWGNFFSVTLHLSGRHKEQLWKKILEKTNKQTIQDLYICVGASQWEHHFEAFNFKKINSLTPMEIKKIVEEKDFLKLATKSPIVSFAEAGNLLVKNYKLLISLCT